VKRVALSLLAIAMLAIPLALPASTIHAQVTYPVGTIALKLYAVPKTIGFLGFQFLKILHNATSSEPYIVTEQYQNVSADANKTIVATITNGTLSNVYKLDNVFYNVSAENVSKTFVAEWVFNVTLGKHYILSPSWIKEIDLYVCGRLNTTNAITKLDVMVWNVSSSSWQLVPNSTVLNSTSTECLVYSFTKNPGELVNSTANDMVYVLFNITSNNVPFKAEIDYFALKVVYTLNVSVSGWSVDQVNKSIVLDKLGNYNVYYHEGFTLTAPSGIVDHNFTVYVIPPDSSRLKYLSLSVNGASTAFRVLPGGVLSYNITNLVSNTSSIEFYAVNALSVTDRPEVPVNAKAGLYATYVYLRNTLSQLPIANVGIYVRNYPSTYQVEGHTEGKFVAMYVNGTEVKPSKEEPGVYYYANLSSAGYSYLKPSKTYTVEVVEKLPMVFLWGTNGTELAATFVKDLNMFEIYIDAPKGTVTNNTFVFPRPPYIAVKPLHIYVNGVRIDNKQVASLSAYASAKPPAWFYEKSDRMLMIKVLHGSPVYIAIQYPVIGGKLVPPNTPPPSAAPRLPMIVAAACGAIAVAAASVLILFRRR